MHVRSMGVVRDIQILVPYANMSKLYMVLSSMPEKNTKVSTPRAVELIRLVLPQLLTVPSMVRRIKLSQIVSLSLGSLQQRDPVRYVLHT